MGNIIMFASLGIGTLVFLLSCLFDNVTGMGISLGIFLFGGGLGAVIAWICGENDYYPSYSSSSTPVETSPHKYSDNEVLIFAKENCKESILTFHSSYPRYNLTAYSINYGFCSIDRKSSSKWYVTLRGSVFEPDIYATGIRKSETFSQTFTISESNGYLFTSGFEDSMARSLKLEKEKFDLYRK